jgi:hypothetical protein
VPRLGSYFAVPVVVAFPASSARFVACEFVRMAALVGGASSKTGDFSLALRIHCGKSAHDSLRSFLVINHVAAPE